MTGAEAAVSAALAVLPMVLGLALDRRFGDPEGFPHPVRAMGRMIQGLESWLRRRFPQSQGGERAAGICLTAAMMLFWGAVPLALLLAAARVHPLLAAALESFFCYQLLAVRSLRTESMKVYRGLQAKDMEQARYAVSRIVGRDTRPLSEEGIIRAAVETVAENTSDGAAAPLFYMAIGGAPLAFVYKAVNTMDSMVGYKNDRYRYFGWCSARMDDLWNLIPARLSGVCMILAAGLLGMDGKGALRIFLRDRYQHKSPNSAQTEAACAGALGIRLAGDAWYFGKLVPKPWIGDSKRPAEAEDIPRACRLMEGTVALAAAFLLGLRFLAVWLILR